MDDTPDEIRDIQFQIMQKMGPAERCRLGFEMIEVGRQITLNSLRLQMPDATDYEIQAALLKRWYEHELQTNQMEACLLALKRSYDKQTGI